MMGNTFQEIICVTKYMSTILLYSLYGIDYTVKSKQYRNENEIKSYIIL